MSKILEALSKVLCAAIFASASVQAELIAENDAGLPSEKYWAYQAPIRPALPTLEHDFIRNPIDAFYSRRLDGRRLYKPNPRAPARHLIRRAYYDLTGLPPAFEAVEAL
jgi:hypothetical protein